MIPLKEYLDVILSCHHCEIVTSKQVKMIIEDPDWQGEQGAYVLENDGNTIGMAGNQLVVLSHGEMRLWHRKDWEICDNKRQQAVKRLDAINQQRNELHDMMTAAVKADFIEKGVTEQVIDMLLKGISFSQIETMFNNIRKIS